MTSHLSTRDVTVGYDGPPVVHDLSLDVPDGTITAIIGPNGCGKSTLLRTMARLLRPESGEVVLDGKAIHTIPTREVARQLGLLPQTPVAPDGLTCADLVGRGRHPHQTWFQQWSRRDEAAVTEALEWTDTSDLADRSLDQLSGGQRQRVWIAMVLAQETDLLLLDEPTTFLDLAHQVEVLDLVARLNKEHGRTVVMVMHDLNLAARYSDTMVAMADGRIAAQGSPHEVIRPDLLESVFGLRAQVVPDPLTGGPVVIPTTSVRTRGDRSDA